MGGSSNLPTLSHQEDDVAIRLAFVTGKQISELPKRDLKNVLPETGELLDQVLRQRGLELHYVSWRAQSSHLVSSDTATRECALYSLLARHVRPLACANSEWRLLRSACCRSESSRGHTPINLG